MNEYSSIRNQSCPNKRCVFYGKTLEGNVTSHSQKYARFKCSECGKTWVPSIHDINYGLRKDPEKFELVQELLKQKVSIRKIAKIVGISPGTVQRWKSKFINQSQND